MGLFLLAKSIVMTRSAIAPYLSIPRQEKATFQAELDRIEPSEKGSVMEVLTSWTEEGIERGRQEEGRSLVLRQLNRRVGTLPETIQTQVEALPLEQLEALGEALLDFTGLADLETWLAQPK
jgi:predicted transposase YdaD